MNIKEKTVALIDDLKSTCQTYGMGNDGNEYKIITQMFLYKFLNDKFGYEVKKIRPKLAAAAKWDLAYMDLSKEERQDIFDEMSPDILRLYPEHLISFLWNQQAKGDFDLIFDNTMMDIADLNSAIFSTQTTKNTKLPLFEKLTQYVTDEAQRASFARALVDKLVNFSFEEAFCEHYDFFAAVFEYLIKDYNTAGGGKYAEYYTPHAIAIIMARLLVGDHCDLHNIECYDPSAGTGTLLMALAHRIGKDRCTIFSQDISQRSNKMLKLNLILNGLVTSLDHAIQGDTLTAPYHKSDDGNALRQFDYIVSNPPFNIDFSDTRNKVAAMPSRFWAGVPNVPAKKKESMAIYTCFFQHVINSLKKDGKGAIVVPSGFLTDTGKIQTEIRNYLITNRCLSTVIQMPTNVFANTNTSVSVIFMDKSRRNDTVMFVDASRMGESVKVDDNTRTVFSGEDEQTIVDAAVLRKCIPEFSIEVSVSAIEENDNLIKPGLYFEMEYPKLKEYHIPMDAAMEKMRQKKQGLIREMRSMYARNIILDWFVDYHFPGASSIACETEYGKFPDNLTLVPLQELVLETAGGEWGKEKPEGKYTNEIKCIRGTDIPNIQIAYYQDVPTRYVQEKHILEKRVKANDIIVEISGGSPVQSTGRTCLMTETVLADLNAPVLCTNFCRIIRLKKAELAEYVYNYILLLYSRGYFFNLENNTTGIKNLIFHAFLQNIKVPVPKEEDVLKQFTKKLDDYCGNLDF